jgi:hypothetical protein
VVINVVVDQRGGRHRSLVGRPNAVSAWLAQYNGQDIVIVSALLIAGWKYTSGLRESLDIGLWDETIYLTQGIDFLHFTLPPPESAPLYAVWYSLLARVSPDPIALYYLNYRMVTLLPPVLFYILLRRYRVSIPTATVLALFLLFTDANFTVWPKVNHFALMVVLVFLILATIPKSWTLGFGMLALGCLFAAYVRPELFFAFVLCFAISLALFLFRERTFLHAVALAALAGAAAATVMYVGYPLGGQRSIIAFSQHFSLNWQSWTHNTSLSPWDDANQIVEMNFGPVTSIGQAILSNPQAFAHHVFTNALNLPKALLSTFTIHEGFLSALHLKPVVGYIVLASGIVGVLVVRRKSIFAHLRVAIREQKRFLLFVCAVGLVIVLSCLIIYPRAHYILLLGTLLLAVLAILIDPLKDIELKPSHSMIAALCTALAIVAVTPSAADSLGNPPLARPTVEAVEFIRALDITGETYLLSSDFGYTTYLAGRWGMPCSIQGCGSWEAVMSYEKSAWDPNDPGKSVSFNSFRRKENINMVLVTDDLLNDTRFRDDAEWKAFLGSPESVGFVKLLLPDGKRALYVDKSILPSA